jgi:hypothetical protein
MVHNAWIAGSPKINSNIEAAARWSGARLTSRKAFVEHGAWLLGAENAG